VPKRAWEVPAENELPEDWTPDSGEPVVEIDQGSEQEMDDQLLQELYSVAWVLKRFGGVFSIAADREEIARDIWRTKRYLILWESYAPGRRQQSPSEPAAEAAAPVPEAEPVPA
jgi:hypothetical protein